MQKQRSNSRFLSPLFPQRQASVLVIILAFNEQGNIPTVVESVRRSVGFADIVVVNDGSTDATAEVAKYSGVTVLDLPVNLGIGGAVQAGMKLALDRGYPFVLRIDGDGQHNPAELPKLLEPVMQGQTDVAIGSRFCNGNRSYCPCLTRRIGIKLFSYVVSWCVGHRVYDTTSGMVCLDRPAIRVLAQHCPQDYPEVEAHILFKKANLKAVEIPVHMRPRMSGVSSINAMRAVYYIFKVLASAAIAVLRGEPQVREENVYVPPADAYFGHFGQHLYSD
jgi:glycosyltransferase involved in cell wall biosynthesis